MVRQSLLQPKGRIVVDRIRDETRAKVEAKKDALGEAIERENRATRKRVAEKDRDLLHRKNLERTKIVDRWTSRLADSPLSMDQFALDNARKARLARQARRNKIQQELQTLPPEETAPKTSNVILQMKQDSIDKDEVILDLALKFRETTDAEKKLRTNFNRMSTLLLNNVKFTVNSMPDFAEYLATPLTKRRPHTSADRTEHDPKLPHYMQDRMPIDRSALRPVSNVVCSVDRNRNRYAPTTEPISMRPSSGRPHLPPVMDLMADRQQIPIRMRDTLIVRPHTASGEGGRGGYSQVSESLAFMDVLKDTSFSPTSTVAAAVSGAGAFMDGVEAEEYQYQYSDDYKVPGRYYIDDTMNGNLATVETNFPKLAMATTDEADRRARRDDLQSLTVSPFRGGPKNGSRPPVVAMANVNSLMDECLDSLFPHMEPISPKGEQHNNCNINTGDTDDDKNDSPLYRSPAIFHQQEERPTQRESSRASAAALEPCGGEVYSTSSSPSSFPILAQRS